MTSFGGRHRRRLIAYALMLFTGIWPVVSQWFSPAVAAATDAGDAQVVTPAGVPLTAGGSATQFSLRLPTGAACTGDSANDGYRVQSYMVSESVAPSSLTFDSQGPIPFLFGAEFSQPLYDAGGSSYVDAQTADAAPPPGPGPVINIPAFAFSVFGPGDVAPGTYNVGIACTQGVASATQLDKFWNVTMVIEASAGDLPAGVTWTVVASQTSTTTMTTTTVAVTTTTTTTSAPTTSPITTTTTPTTAPTTTSASTSTSTTRPPTTTSTTSTTSIPGAATSTSISALMSSQTGLARTGGSTLSLVVLLLLLLDLGWWAVRFGRRQPPPSRPTR